MYEESILDLAFYREDVREYFSHNVTLVNPNPPAIKFENFMIESWMRW